MELTKEFWNDRYVNQDTGWDLGDASPAITEYFDQLENKNAKILIPGCGNGHEGEYLFKQGFTNLTLLDFSKTSKENFLARNPNFDASNYYVGDFFKHQGEYDFVVEQTFFCAIDKNLRAKYAKKMNELLCPTGKLVGLMFNVPLNEDHPPYGGDKKEYLTYFSPYFSSIQMDPCRNSVKSRDGREFFIKMSR